MTDLRKQWAIVQKRVPPPAHWRKHKNALTSWKVAYAELVAALPRPIRVVIGWGQRRHVFCRLCDDPSSPHAVSRGERIWSTSDVRDADLAIREHMEGAHGCPNRHTTGEPCDTTCIHCHGWQWCAKPNERREL